MMLSTVNIKASAAVGVTESDVISYDKILNLNQCKYVILSFCVTYIRVFIVCLGKYSDVKGEANPAGKNRS